MTAHARAAIVTIGDEIVTGDIQNTNGAWLAKRLEALGIGVTLQLAVRDDMGQIRVSTSRVAEIIARYLAADIPTAESSRQSP